MSNLVVEKHGGLYCEAGDFHIDPWAPVDRAVVTHAHSDHARWGSGSYLTSTDGVGVLRARLGQNAAIHGIPYGETVEMNGVRVSLHPAGHLLGSAQVRIEHRGEVWVITGDYKRQPDPTCRPFELLSCHTLITESTFGLPIYRWPEPAAVMAEINAWWRENRERGWTSVILTYTLGKPQRLLAGLDASIGPIVLHGAIARFMPAYLEAGVAMPPVCRAGPENIAELRGRAMVIAPMSAVGTPWLRKFAPFSDAFVSGWTRIRGTRRRRSVDRGFVMSDHVDWPALLQTIEETGAERVGVTHGYTSVVVRWLREHGRDAWALATRYGEEDEESGAATDPPAEPLPGAEGT